MVLEIHLKLCVATPDFSTKKKPKKNQTKLGKSTKNGPKTGFFEFKENFCHLFLLNLFYNENLYYLLCFCTNLIFGKILVSEIWPKRSQPVRLKDFLINHISGTN